MSTSQIPHSDSQVQSFHHRFRGDAAYRDTILRDPSPVLRELGLDDSVTARAKSTIVGEGETATLAFVIEIPAGEETAEAVTFEWPDRWALLMNKTNVPLNLEWWNVGLQEGAHPVRPHSGHYLGIRTLEEWMLGKCNLWRASFLARDNRNNHVVHEGFHVTCGKVINKMEATEVNGKIRIVESHPEMP
jgi:hypothetical protein